MFQQIPGPLQGSITVISDRGKCANSRITGEQSVETQYLGFIQWVSRCNTLVVVVVASTRCFCILIVSAVRNYVNCMTIVIRNYIYYILSTAETVKIAGYFAIAGTLSLAVFCVLSIVQLAMIVSKEKVVFAYSKTVVTKLVFAFAASKYTMHNMIILFSHDISPV